MLTKNVGFVMFPEADEGQFQAQIELPTGINVTESNKIARKVEYFLNENYFPHMQHTFYYY